MTNAERQGSTIAVLGTGAVGGVLARGLAAEGYQVILGSRDGKVVEGWTGATATFGDAAAQADLAVLAVKGSVAGDLVGSITEQLSGKTVIDTTNPIADRPPTDGVLSYFTTLDESLMEQLQQRVPGAHFVKAFNSVGNGRMVHPSYDGIKPTMFIAGNDTGAKDEASAILDSLGWEVEDLGTAAAARAIEPLCMLWCIPAMRGGGSTHAFKLLRD